MIAAPNSIGKPKKIPTCDAARQFEVLSQSFEIPEPSTELVKKPLKSNKLSLNLLEIGCTARKKKNESQEEFLNRVSHISLAGKHLSHLVSSE